MRCRRMVAALVFVPLMLSLPSLALSSLFEPVPDRDLVCEATDVVHGQVTNVAANWDRDRTAIWTTATVQVDGVIRGNLAPGTRVQVKEVGGTVNDYTIKAESFPTFQEGQEVVLLLRPWEDDPGVYRVWGYGRGMFVVDRSAEGEPSSRRYDVVESGHPTMFTDRIPPHAVLGALNRELATLARECRAGGPPR